jgi:hypothetical protein
MMAVLRFVSTSRPPQQMFKMFLFILFIATYFGLSDGHPQVNVQNIKTSCYFYDSPEDGYQIGRNMLR